MRSYFCVTVLLLGMGLCVNILIHHEDSDTEIGDLQITPKFMCPFSEMFYFAHSLLIPLQSLSSFCRPKITIKASLPVTSYFLFSFFLLMCLHCHKMLSYHPEIYPESPFLTMTIKNPHSYPDNDTTPLKWWACGQPLDLWKHLGLIFLKILESRSNALLVHVITSRRPVHTISRGQIVCLLLEETHLRGSSLSPFWVREKVPLWWELAYYSESHFFPSNFHFFPSLYSGEWLFRKNLSHVIPLQEKIKGNGRSVGNLGMDWSGWTFLRTVPFHSS